MALPPVPGGYDSWNDYIETEAPALAMSEGITLQQAKASIKLLMVSRPIREQEGEPYYRELNYFTTWADRSVLPFVGRPTTGSAPAEPIISSPFPATARGVIAATPEPTSTA